MSEEIQNLKTELAKLEAIVAERWKTAFRRFDEMETSIQRIEQILIGGAGAAILFMAGLIVTLVTLHG
ncbi:hypothetical protein [uncultured virus]|uniref:Uncharacterized protein n=1 Tax=uncultured virus TaxID=340016 RepID=A0A218MM09_9VIRU|nr:hypothetical protein [uncultured virus]